MVEPSGLTRVEQSSLQGQKQREVGRILRWQWELLPVGKTAEGSGVVMLTISGAGPWGRGMSPEFLVTQA